MIPLHNTKVLESQNVFMNNMKICIIYSVNVREPGASCLDSFVITKDTKQKVLTIKFYWLVNLETLQYILFQFLFKMFGDFRG